MSTAGKERIVTVTISLILVVVLYSNLTLPKEYIIESNNLALSSSQDNSPELTAVSHWGGLGSTSSCQVHDSAQSADGNIGSSATFQMSQPSSSPSCDLAINLQYNYKVVNGSIIKPSYFDIEIEYSRSMPSEQNCAWVSILAVNGPSNPADGTVILNPLGNQPVQTYYSIGSSSCTDGTEHAVPLPSSPITTDMRDVSSQLQSYSNSQHSGFTIEIFVNPSDEPQFNLYIKEVTIIPSNTCLNDSDCDGISDSEEDNGDDDDIDGDGVGNDVDVDDDNDSVNDAEDPDSQDPEIWGDAYDDYDNDGVLNYEDVFPSDPTRTLDDDGDGLAVEDEGSILDNIHETNLPMFLSVVYVILIIGLTFIANIIHKRYNE